MFLARRAAAWSAVTVNPKCAAGMYLPFCSGEILPVANVAGGPFFAYYLGGPFLLLFTIIHPPVFGAPLSFDAGDACPSCADKSPVERRSLNRSQCGGCSTKYDTPTES